MNTQLDRQSPVVFGFLDPLLTRIVSYFDTLLTRTSATSNISVKFEPGLATRNTSPSKKSWIETNGCT